VKYDINVATRFFDEASIAHVAESNIEVLANVFSRVVEPSPRTVRIIQAERAYVGT
jgi:hypothetical protein